MSDRAQTARGAAEDATTAAVAGWECLGDDVKVQGRQNCALTDPLRLLLSNMSSSKVMSADIAPDRTVASSARPLGVVTPASESTCIWLVAWMESLPPAAAALEDAAQLMADGACLLLPLVITAVAVKKPVGVHS
jgi:hypothetical protein